MSSPTESARVDELFKQLHASIPAQAPPREDIIRGYAIAKWRNELSHRMEAAFFSSAVADELANPESQELIEKYGEDILLGVAIRRDAAGPNALTKILRYQSSVNKNLKSASAAYERMLDELQKELAIEKAKPISQPAAQAVYTEPGLPNSETGRNAPCPCGSGIRNKRCCGAVSFAVSKAA